jgi:hypothetical protein
VIEAFVFGIERMIDLETLLRGVIAAFRWVNRLRIKPRQQSLLGVSAFTPFALQARLG